METENLPPEQDLKALIKQEHHRAEIERLETGQEGCGCSDCQEIYKTIDLKKYGNRVKRYSDITIIQPKRKKGDGDADEVSNHDGNPQGNDKRVLSQVVNDIRGLDSDKTTFDGGKHAGGRPRKTTDYSKRTEYRRKQELQGVFAI